MPPERLQKIMAAAGISSRRKAEEFIKSGLVSVNGNVVTELGTKADPETDSIRVNGKLLQGAERHEYIAFNKPRGYVTTVSDPEGRPTVMDLIRSKARLYPVGRLDFNSEGLLLLTNDGDLAHKLMKAASHIPKTYLVKVAGQPAEDQLRRLRSGISIAEERDPNKRVRTARAEIRVIKEADNPWLEVTLYEGRNRQIRKMFEEIGHHVEKIRRVRYGPLQLDVPPSESRPLEPQEVARLQHAIDAPPRMGARPERDSASTTPERRPQRDRERGDRPPSRARFGPRPDRERSARPQPAGGFGDRDARREDTQRPSRQPEFGEKGDRPSQRRSIGDRSSSNRPAACANFGRRPATSRPFSDRNSANNRREKPAFGRGAASNRPFRGPRRDDERSGRPSFQRSGTADRPQRGPRMDAERRARPAFSRTSAPGRPPRGPRRGNDSRERPSFRRDAAPRSPSEGSDRADNLSERPAWKPRSSQSRPFRSRPAGDKNRENSPREQHGGPRKPPSGFSGRPGRDARPGSIGRGGRPGGRGPDRKNPSKRS